MKTWLLFLLSLVLIWIGGFYGGISYQTRKDKNAVIIASTIAQTFREMENASHYENYKGDEMIWRMPWGDVHKNLAKGKIVYLEAHFTGPDEMESRFKKALEFSIQYKKDHPELYK